MNDYTDAGARTPADDDRQEWLWHTLSVNTPTGSADFSTGQWIFEATLRQDGSCATPDARQAELFIQGVKRAQEAFAAPSPTMTPLSINGLSVSSAEYWPFVEGLPQPYPNAVLWGFYPQEASPAAVRCGETAWAALKAFMTENPADMQRVVALGATASFFLWVDDYAQAGNDHRNERSARMWHWNGAGDGNLAHGFWKWESKLTRTGVCEIPRRSAIDATLRAAIRQLEQAQ